MKKLTVFLFVGIFALVTSGCGKDEKKAPAATSPESQTQTQTQTPTQPEVQVPPQLQVEIPENPAGGNPVPAPVVRPAEPELCYGAYSWSQSGVVSTWRFDRDGSLRITIQAPQFPDQVTTFNKEQCDQMRQSYLRFSADCGQVVINGQTYTR